MTGFWDVIYNDVKISHTYWRQGKKKQRNPTRRKIVGSPEAYWKLDFFFYLFFSFSKGKFEFVPSDFLNESPNDKAFVPVTLIP